MSGDRLPVEMPPGVEVVGPATSSGVSVLTPEALAFVAELQRRFGAERERLLAGRRDRQAALDAGARPTFLPETAEVRAADWTVAETPRDLQDRRVEITGPAEPKMMINALNSGARVFMADLEDALSPTWDNVVEGQAAIAAAVRGTLAFDAPDGRSYRLGERVAKLLVRPRGWHLLERHLLVDGAPVSASLFDAGLFLFHDLAASVERRATPAFYLPKLESHREARLWNDVFVFAQERLGAPVGTVRATVLIETGLAAFEMDEILWELRDHAAGLNAGRWDYLFSIIKKFRSSPSVPLELPDRSQLTMTVPFMRAYTQQLVRVCHRRGAHAIGGMAAFIPSRRDAEVNAVAMARVRDDKERESADGFDGTWVAHPDLVPLATEVFDGVLGDRANQKDAAVDGRGSRSGDADAEAGLARRLLDFAVPGGSRSEAGLRANVSVAIAYLDAWLRGNGAAAINNLMEDAATAEIARSQLWLWRSRADTLSDGRRIDADLYRRIRDEELARLEAVADTGGGRSASRAGEAAALLDALVLSPEFAEFLTIPAYDLLP